MSQKNDLLPMELPLMSSQADSPAKTLALPAAKSDSERERGRDYGPKSPDLLASYDRATSSWRTSQTCLVALAKNEADGLAEYSETWPRSGMTRSGTACKLTTLDDRRCGIASGLWPSPTASDWKESGKISRLAAIWNDPHYSHQKRPQHKYAAQFGALAGPNLSAWIMGFPIGWASGVDMATPSSRKSPK